MDTSYRLCEFILNSFNRKVILRMTETGTEHLIFNFKVKGGEVFDENISIGMK